MKTKTENQKTLPKKVKSNPGAGAVSYDELQDLFQATPEMQAWQEFCTEARKAVESGKSRAELPTAFLKLVLDDLATDPLRHPEILAAWNRLCDAQGAPEHKLNEPGPSPTDGNGEGPF